VNPKFLSVVAVCSVFVTIIILLAACGQGSRRVPTMSSIGTQQAGEPAAMEQQVTWPGTLPDDKAQPWEELDANGNVIPPKAAEGPERSRRASNLNFDSIFASGIERYLEAGDVTTYGDRAISRSGRCNHLRRSVIVCQRRNGRRGNVLRHIPVSAGR